MCSQMKLMWVQESCTEFQITTKKKSIILKANSVEHMHEWLNAILKHKIVIEQIIDTIVESDIQAT